MKKLPFLMLLLAFSVQFIAAQDAPKVPKVAKPIGGMEWLIGGVWKADASAMGNEMDHIETRYAWSDNGAFIRFTTHFVMKQGTLKNYDGSFFWDPAKSALQMWYMSAAGEISQGTIEIKGDTTFFRFKGANFEGQPADLRVSVMRRSSDHYTWSVEEMRGDAWKQLASLEYLRTKEI